jgi:hypothetical protein
VTSQTPIDGVAGVSRTVAPRADFDTALDPSTVTAATFTLRPAGGSPVPATVSYDQSQRRAKLVPAAPLDASTVYVAALGSGIQADDGTPLAATSWQFTTASDDVPQVTSTSPGDGAMLISGGAPVRATFAAALDAASVDAGAFRLEGPDGPVAAAVSYDAATTTASLTPVAPLSAATTYTATLGTGVRSSAGVPLAAPVSWSFTTSACPCRLFGPSDGPAATGRPVQDGRSGPGPFSYEMGVKVRVSQPAELAAVRFYKSPGETGTHIGRVWSASGAELGWAMFSDESASGWQEQALNTPISLTPGQTYVVSVGINDFYVVTTGALSSSVASGPLWTVADGANGVFGPKGSFPTDTWGSSNYFIDTVVH